VVPPRAQAGEVRALKYLGRIYLYGYGLDGVTENEAQAATWYRRAAEQGDAEAQNQLGLMYFLGWGVQENKTVRLNLGGAGPLSRVALSRRQTSALSTTADWASGKTTPPP
jgi:TPR repeat protein